MWTLLKAEFRYHRLLLAVYTGIFLLLFLYVSESLFVYTILPFLAAQQMMSAWLLEKRIRLFAGLPVASRNAAVVRVLLLLVPLLAVSAWYSLFHMTITPERLPGMLQPWRNAGVVSFFYFVLFLLLDLNPGFGSIKGISRRLVTSGLVVCCLSLGLVVILLLIERSGASPPVVKLITDPMIAVVRFVFSPTRAILVNCANVGLAALTVWTYGRRRSYL